MNVWCCEVIFWLERATSSFMQSSQFPSFYPKHRIQYIWNIAATFTMWSCHTAILVYTMMKSPVTMFFIRLLTDMISKQQITILIQATLPWQTTAWVGLHWQKKITKIKPKSLSKKLGMMCVKVSISEYYNTHKDIETFFLWMKHGLLMDY